MSLSVPTVPTEDQSVGTVQPIEKIRCPDRLDCPDLFTKGSRENERSLSGLVERLRERRCSSSTLKTRHVDNTHPSLLVSPPTTMQAVGTVGTVGTVNEISGLESGRGDGASRDSRDSRDRPCPAMASTTPQTSLNHWIAGVAILQRMPLLPGFSPGRWRTMVQDCASLLDQWGAEMHRLGWSAVDGFGVHPWACGGAVQCYGLGILLNGKSVTELTSTKATIDCLGGVCQSFTRRSATGAVPIWTVEVRSIPDRSHLPLVLGS